MNGKIKCYVCGRMIGIFGWANHIKKEKRLHGDDIYKRMKAERMNQYYEPKPQTIQEFKSNMKLTDFQG
jgi:hypothetical protein